MLLLLEVAAGTKPFAAWIPVSESLGRSKNEKLEIYLKLLYELLRDLMLIGLKRNGLRDQDLKRELTALAASYPADRIARATRTVDALVDLVRRNIQKIIALDDLILQI